MYQEPNFNTAKCFSEDRSAIEMRKRWENIYQEPNFSTAKCFSEDRIAIEMRKTEVYMITPVYQAILHISKALMYTFYYDYLKPTYNDKVKLC